MAYPFFYHATGGEKLPTLSILELQAEMAALSSTKELKGWQLRTVDSTFPLAEGPQKKRGTKTVSLIFLNLGNGTITYPHPAGTQVKMFFFSQGGMW